MNNEDTPKTTGKATPKTVFNPIKEFTGDQRISAIQWTTDILDVAIKGLGKGKRLVANPFYENNVKLLKPNLVFVRSEEEVKEWVRCSQDLPYFIETYAKFMTPTGLKNITLRDYQWDYLDLLLHNQLTIMRSARQSGKCVSFLARIQTNKRSLLCHPFNKIHKANYYIKEDIYEIPLYEIYNCFDRSIRWRIQYIIYKIIDRLTYAKQKRIEMEHIQDE